MHCTLKVISTVLFALTLALSAPAQKPRSTDTDSAKKDPARPAPAPQTIKAKYEGGVFGYNKVQDGTLVFEDVNSRLVFRNQKGKEVFSIPYSSISQEFADT